MSIHISDEDVMAALDPDMAIRLTEEAYAAHAGNRIAAAPRLSAAIPGSLNSFIVLPAIPLDHPYFGYKFASSFPGNTNLGLPTVTSHINAMGSFTPDMQEIDARTIERCSKIVVDVAADAWAHAGDLIRPLEAGIIGRDAIYGTLGDIVSGALPGRSDPREITLFESIGFGVLDVALAIAAYEACGRPRK